MFTLIHSIGKLLSSSFIFIFISTNVSATIKTWTGLANDGMWATAINWSGGSLPSSTDDVLLDNSFVSTNYDVTLPDMASTVKSLTISPSLLHSIKLILPSTNLFAPGFIATGPGYGITINEGGIFQNSSGITSGSSLTISDSIRINNGGRYIHNTRSIHASSIVQFLSKAPGTESGIFEFDTPGTQGYTISISNRTYGTLVLSADASPGGIKTYTGSGNNPLAIQGDFQIGAGVTFKSDLATKNGNINLAGDFIQNGGVLDLASGPDSSILKIKGNLTQSPGSVITESVTGLPAIELVGSSVQNISMLGSISNNITFRMNNLAGAVLQAPLSLPYKLELLNGNITTTSNNILTLQPGCTISVDSTIANKSFISGPLRKEGLSAAGYFLFPVGKPNEFRWLELKNATGNFEVEFISGDARGLSTSYASGINHISSHGYWAIDADASPSPSAKVELSFADATASGVTEMATLKASQLSSGVWVDRNNTATTGTPGAAGSVVSENIAAFGSTSRYFVLASSVANENPLPVILVDFYAVQGNNGTSINWEVSQDADVDYFEILAGTAGNNLKAIAHLSTSPGILRYHFIDEHPLGINEYYQLHVIEKDGGSYQSKIIVVTNRAPNSNRISIAPNLVEGPALLIINSSENQQLRFAVYSMDGKMVTSIDCNAVAGRNVVSIDLSKLSSGGYLLKGMGSGGQNEVLRFIKK